MPRPRKYDSPPDLYQCSLCGKKKIKTEFYDDNRRSVGVTAACRDCMRDDRIRMKYVRMAEEGGIESLLALKEKSERTLSILNRVIDQLRAKE